MNRTTLLYKSATLMEENHELMYSMLIYSPTDQPIRDLFHKIDDNGSDAHRVGLIPCLAPQDLRQCGQ